MSLINEALKKAQKQRTGDSPPLASMPGVGGEPAARIARRAKPVGFNSLLIRIGLGAGALIVLAVAGFFLVRVMHNKPVTPPPAKAAPAAETASGSSVSVATPAPPVPAATSANTFVLPVAAPPATPTEVAKSGTAGPKPEPAKPKVETPPLAVAPAATPMQSPPAAPPLKLLPKAISFIENLRIAGIRASATDSKVLMNDHVYRVGDMVEHELGLKLTGITSGTLTFEDERGAVYTRQF